MDPTLPELNELEVSVFGRGYGEAICVHLGDGEWAIVDSCINPHTGRPAALSYFDALGLSPDDVVQVVVATHWDDDHIRGLSSVVDASPNATFVCSAALRQKEALAFVIEQESAKGVLGSGVDEFRAILRVCRERSSRVLWAKANTPLHPSPPGDRPTVVALSPSEDAFERSIQSLIEAATDARSSLPRRYRAPEGPNGASVATSVKLGDLAVLLGADLEVSNNEEAGWEAVVRYSAPSIRASAVKVPHHGSPGAHHDGMWAELVEDEPVAVLTPWARGERFLPDEEDLRRLKSVAKHVLLTATPSLARVEQDPELERMIRRLHGERISELRGWGHVRLRRGPGESEWRIALDGDATTID